MCSRATSTRTPDLECVPVCQDGPVVIARSLLQSRHGLILRYHKPCNIIDSDVKDDQRVIILILVLHRRPFCQI